MFVLDEVAQLRVMNAQAAGATDVNSSIIDTQAYEADSFLFTALFGTLTAGQVTSLRAQQGAAANGSDMADITGSSTGPLGDGNSNAVLALEVFRPTARYLRCVVKRATQNAVIDGVVCTIARPRAIPVTQPATVIASKTVNFAAAGTA